MAASSSVAYPIFVYFGMSRLPPGAIVAVGIALIGLRLAGTRRMPQSTTKAEAAALVLAAAALAGLLLLDPHRAALAYPVFISLTTAMVFGLSLIWPPTVIERIARLREPDLSPAGVVYTRKVTVAWMLFLMANAVVSGASALWGTIEQWMLWNGLISYALMGLLFAGEVGVRRVVRHRAAV